MWHINIILALALFCCYNPRLRRQTGEHDHVVLSSIFVGGTLDEPVPYCPYYAEEWCVNRYTNKLAYSNISNYDDINISCCEGCLRRSGTMTCCQEIMPCEGEIRNDHGQPLVCISTVSGLAASGVLAVGTCPEHTDDDLALKCVQRYIVGGSYDVDVNDVLPVRESTTGILYRNIHCALCNWLGINDITFWSLGVACLWTSNVNLATDSNLLNTIHNTSDCYFMFEDPEPAVKVETCSISIDKCNVTGIMSTQSYNPVRLQKCLNGTRDEIINRKHGIIFKNKHCFKCNIPSLRWAHPLDLGNPSFSVVLAFNGTTDAGNAQPSKCAHDMVFIQTKGQCVTARCSLLRQLRGNVCERTIPNPDRFAYRIGFRLIPQSALSVDTGYEIIPELGDQINKMLDLVFPAVEPAHVLFQILLVADVEYTETFNVSEILQSGLIFYEMRLKFVNIESHDPEQKLIEMFALEDKAELNIQIGQYNISFKLTMNDDLAHFPTNTRIQTLSLPCSVFINDFSTCLDALSTPKIFKTFHPENLTAVPYIGHWRGGISRFFKAPFSNERSILELRECPFVEVKRSEMTWTETELGIEFANKPDTIPVKASDYVYGEHSDIIWMCLEAYEDTFRSRVASNADYPLVDLVLNVLMFSLFVSVIRL